MAAVESPSRDMWDSVAPGWKQHAGYVDARGAHVTDRMLELTAPRPGECVLELACGPASVGLAAAGLVAPDGKVVASDVAPAMAAIAAGRIAERGLTNVTTAVLDLERIDQADGSYDVVLVREGLMLVHDPARAASEIRRVLAPGGRLAVSVWGPRERNPWLGIVFDTFTAQLGAPVPLPGTPGPFSLDDAVRLGAILSAAGLSGIVVQEVDTPYRSASVDEWWQRTCDLAGPLGKRLASLPPQVQRSLRERACAEAETYATVDGGIDIPGVCLVAGASRPRD